MHQLLKGFRCSAETCSFTSGRLKAIRAHVQESHSIKNPQVPGHFQDHYNARWVLEDEAGSLEDDVYTVYECLDGIMDAQVFGNSGLQDQDLKVSVWQFLYRK